MTLKPGETMRVGRAAPADIVIAEDNALSRLHFELHFDGKVCWLRDLNSTNGTLHNGVRTTGGRISDGDLIAAGKTRFAVAIEDAVLPVPSEPADIDHSQLIKILSTSVQPLYAVLDLSQGPEVLKQLLESKHQYFSLFEGEDAERLMPFAPVLVALPAHSALLTKMVELGWSNHWGIFINSHAAVDQIWHFFRWLLIAVSPEGSASMLRFYDPRVLRALLPKCTAVQLQQLFSVVRYYITEAESPDEAFAFSLTQHGLQRTILSLSGKPAETKIEPIAQGWSMHGDRFALTAEQAQKLQEKKRDSMPDNVLAQVGELRPALLRTVGERRLRFLAQSACDRATNYGIRTQADILKYVLLQVELGSHFDVDPAMPWAAQILRMRLKPAEKLARLMEWASALSKNKQEDIHKTSVVQTIRAGSSKK